MNVCVHICALEIGGDVSCECIHTFGRPVGSTRKVVRLVS